MIDYQIFRTRKEARGQAAKMTSGCVVQLPQGKCLASFACMCLPPLIALLIIAFGVPQAEATTRGALKNDATEVPSTSMTFTEQGTGGNCESCEWILAEGEIDEGTTERFKQFLATQDDGVPNNIRFNSPGGNLIEALKFGRYLRDSHWNTFVSEYGAIQKSVCYSACVYAFAGGVHRTAEDRAVGIHQFYRADDAARPNDKTITPVDVANMQRLTAVLNEYAREMGIDTRMVSIASAITPWDPIYLLSSSELQSLNLDNQRPPRDSAASADWHVQPAGDGAVAVTTQAQDGAGRTASLGIMSFQGLPEMFVVELTVSDKTKDWQGWWRFWSKSEGGLAPQDFTFDLDGEYGHLDSKRLIYPVTLMDQGVRLALVITREELNRMINAKSVDIDGFECMASERWVGELGGTFSMVGAADVVALALKNYIRNGYITTQILSSASVTSLSTSFQRAVPQTPASDQAISGAVDEREKKQSKPSQSWYTSRFNSMSLLYPIYPSQSISWVSWRWLHFFEGLFSPHRRLPLAFLFRRMLEQNSPSVLLEPLERNRPGVRSAHAVDVAFARQTAVAGRGIHVLVDGHNTHAELCQLLEDRYQVAEPIRQRVVVLQDNHIDLAPARLAQQILDWGPDTCPTPHQPPAAALTIGDERPRAGFLDSWRVYGSAAVPLK
jgi:hypothetical protein